MAASAGTILQQALESGDLAYYLDRYIHALGYAPGMDIGVFEQEDWQKMNKLLTGLRELVAELAKKYKGQIGKTAEQISAQAVKKLRGRSR